MSLTLQCNVESLERSRLPNIFMLRMKCVDGIEITMDIHREVNVVDQGMNTEFTISKTLPQYRDGVDFVARGYVITKRESDEYVKVLISLWGFLVVLQVPHAKSDLVEFLNPMDEIYVKISRP